MRVLNLIVSLSLSLVLSSCAVYSTGFTCPDSKGAKCMMLSEVDTMVDSGEIETVYMDKKCKGGRCKNTANVPQKALTEIHRIKVEPEKDVSDIQYQDSDYLYVK